MIGAKIAVAGIVTIQKVNVLGAKWVTIKERKINQNVYQKQEAASLRASGGKKAIANAVKRKRKNDPNKNRRGKAKNVNNHPKKK